MQFSNSTKPDIHIQLNLSNMNKKIRGPGLEDAATFTADKQEQEEAQ